MTIQKTGPKQDPRNYVRSLAPYLVSAEFAGETWTALCQFALRPLRTNNGSRTYVVSVTRDGEVVRGATWLVPPGERTITDGTLVATNPGPIATEGLLALSAAIRRHACEAMRAARPVAEVPQ